MPGVGIAWITDPEEGLGGLRRPSVISAGERSPPALDLAADRRERTEGELTPDHIYAQRAERHAIKTGAIEQPVLPARAESNNRRFVVLSGCLRGFQADRDQPDHSKKDERGNGIVT